MPQIKLQPLDESLIRFDDPSTLSALFNAVYAISQCLNRDYAIPFESDVTIHQDIESLKLTEIKFILDNLSKFYSVMVANEMTPH